LESLLQQPSPENPNAEITIITHNTNQAGLKNVLQGLSQLPVVKQIKSVYRVIG